MEIVKHREVITVTERRIAFDRLDEPSSGFWFQIGHNKRPVFDNDTQKENYDYCMAHPEEYSKPHIVSWERKYIEPAVGRCHCGALVCLGAHGEDTFCEKCGQMYNAFGQELRPPEEWEEPWDEYYY